MFSFKIPIHGIPGQTGNSFDTEAVLTIGWTFTGGPVDVGFKAHVPSIDPSEGPRVILRAITSRGWRCSAYHQVLRDEAFIPLLHQCGVPMRIRLAFDRGKMNDAQALYSVAPRAEKVKRWLSKGRIIVAFFLFLTAIVSVLFPIVESMPARLAVLTLISGALTITALIPRGSIQWGDAPAVAGGITVLTTGWLYYWYASEGSLEPLILTVAVTATLLIAMALGPALQISWDWLRRTSSRAKLRLLRKR